MKAHLNTTVLIGATYHKVREPVEVLTIKAQGLHVERTLVSVRFQDGSTGYLYPEEVELDQ